MKTNHSPLPWKLGARSNDSATIRVSNTNLGIGDMYRVEDAAFIVKSANAHHDLVAACTLALALIKDTWVAEHGNEQVGMAWGALESALAKVQS